MLIAFVARGILSVFFVILVQAGPSELPSVKHSLDDSSLDFKLEYKPDSSTDHGDNTLLWWMDKRSQNRTSRLKRSLMKTASRMPGTNWCGRGWRAEGFQDLGTYGPTDQCCRQHDLGCPASIMSGETLAGLYNNWMYTVMHCPCDERFRMCLKMTHSPFSDTVGRFFFNVLKTPCFIVAKEKKCVERAWWFGECKKYEESFVAQWKDPLPY